MLLRGVLEKRSGDGEYRPRAFELTLRELAYEERLLTAEKKTRTKRAGIPSSRIGSVLLRDERLVLFEVGGAYAHFLRFPTTTTTTTIPWRRR
mmetsp:Transcript_23891/g.76841  ORF Transcript_23891/g.76841 Transcript_23891/m.76841 type:complete len:93 (-) Transcript_23891:1892-2170(-)